MPYHSIGQPGSPTVDLFRKHGLTALRKVLSPEVFEAVWPGPAHPNAVLVPSVVFWLMTAAALNDGTLAATVLTFWNSVAAVCPALRMKSVTEEAFCMARRALPMRFFRALFNALVQRQFNTHAHRWLWHGKNLLGIDGTLVTLPPDKQLLQSYRPASNQRGACKHPQALLVGLVGLWSGLCCAFVLVPPAQAEQWCACWLSRYLCFGDLLLGDRNFAFYEMMARVVRRGADFLFRLPAGRFHKLPRRATNSGRTDEWLVDLKLPAALRKRCPHLPAVVTVRILEYHLPGYRVSWLITSLTDARTYSYDEVVGLYHQRWNQETMHREWKYTLQLSNLRSHSVQGICKEVFVQLTLNNTVRALQAEALPLDGKPLRLKFLDTKRLVVAAIPTMAQAPIQQLPVIYAHLLRKIATLVIDVRPGRSYPRRGDGKPKNKGGGRMVQPARLPNAAGATLGHV
ncbi:MAG TPA: IS4 family transposase [Planctomycetota bacterium]|jgi:hypothetical protein